jgi:hypothetical protein
MKKLFSVSIIALLLLALAFAFLQKEFQTTALRPANGYPPPEDRYVITENAYPPPGTPPNGTPTVALTKIPTVNPLTPAPPPEFWPTDLPWPPPTSTPKPFFTPVVELFPTLQFAFLDEKVSDDVLDSIWYPYYKGKNAEIVLEELKIDEMGNRKEQPKTRIGLSFGLYAEYPRLLALQMTSDSAYFAYQAAEREGANWELYEMSSGKNLSIKERYGFGLVEFYRWSPDGKYFLAFINKDDSRASASLIGIEDGKRVVLKAAEHDGILPEIDDMAFSPDGDLIAAALSYHPYSGKNNPWMNEISIWKAGDPSSREILCRGENGKDTEIHTLKWSPDGQKLLWVGGLETADVEHWVLYLWLADRSTGKCEPIIEMGIARGQGFPVSGKFSADWSPDGSQVAVHLIDEKDGNSLYRIALLDINSRTVMDLVGPTQNVLSNVQFSPYGSLIFYSISRIDYGEIWAVSLEGGSTTLIAGPTTISAPFWFDKK